MLRPRGNVSYAIDSSIFNSGGISNEHLKSSICAINDRSRPRVFSSFVCRPTDREFPRRIDNPTENRLSLPTSMYGYTRDFVTPPGAIDRGGRFVAIVASPRALSTLTCTFPLSLLRPTPLRLADLLKEGEARAA